MFLGRYEFDGDPRTLAQAYDRMLADIDPGSIQFQVCIQRDGGLSVYDTCPSAAVFEAFSSSPATQEAFEAAGLPRPRVTPLGEVYRAMAAPEHVTAER